MIDITFPKGFLWGAASSAFQIEGSQEQDGRGSSIWDDFCRQPGKIADNSDGLTACDHVERYKEDVRLLANAGFKAYRFSISWPRILPEGRGEVNTNGIEFYSNLVDELLAHGITPWVTLYHWDLPSALEREGGWRNRSTAYAFADYAAIVVKALGDRVQHWITHNEPWCVAVLGHRIGEHAPGMQDENACLLAAHHVLLSHGLAMRQIRTIAPDAQAGITLNLTPAYAADPNSSVDKAAAERFDGDFNRWYLDPLIKGHYPQDMLEYHFQEGHVKEGGWDFIQPEDLDVISQKLDFLGVNYYSRAVLGDRGHSEQMAMQDPQRYTAMGWEIYPQGLTDLMLRLQIEYPVEAYYITENGAAFADKLKDDGQVDDTLRSRYFHQHCKQLITICGEGVPLKGYFAWSILDNFEWAHGYSKRFGLVYVDYETQRRIPKLSYFWFKQVIAENRLIACP